MSIRDGWAERVLWMKPIQDPTSPLSNFYTYKIPEDINERGQYTLETMTMGWLMDRYRHHTDREIQQIADVYYADQHLIYDGLATHIAGELNACLVITTTGRIYQAYRQYYAPLAFHRIELEDIREPILRDAIAAEIAALQQP
jgi:hypothetical protein